MPTKHNDAEDVAEAPLRAEWAIRSLADATLADASLVLFAKTPRHVIALRGVLSTIHNPFSNEIH